jgi:hypothetical protein
MKISPHVMGEQNSHHQVKKFHIFPLAEGSHPSGEGESITASRELRTR